MSISMVLQKFQPNLIYSLPQTPTEHAAEEKKNKKNKTKQKKIRQGH